MFARDKLPQTAPLPLKTRMAGNGRNSALKAGLYQDAFLALKKLMTSTGGRQLTASEKEIRDKFTQAKRAFVKLKRSVYIVDGYYGHSHDDYTIAEQSLKISSLANSLVPDRNQVFMLAENFAAVAKRRLLEHDSKCSVYFTKADNRDNKALTPSPPPEIRIIQPAALELVAA